MSTLPNLSPDLKHYIDTVVAAQRANPHIECFTQIHVTGVGWRLTSALTGKEYTPDSYYQEFGKYPPLPHPETLSGKGFGCYWGFVPPKQKRPKAKGFG